MKKNQFKLFMLLTSVGLFLVTTHSWALNYTVSFSATGLSSTLDSVIVKNITQGTTLKLNAGYDLNLVSTISSLGNTPELLNGSLRIIPNPIKDNSMLRFDAPEGGMTFIQIFSIDGRTMAAMQQYCAKGTNNFQVSLPAGIYTINIRNKEYKYVAKAISQSGAGTLPGIVFSSNTNPRINYQKVNSVLKREMLYNDGDVLLYYCYSNGNCTVVSDVPTGNKTTIANLVDCTDTNGNKYNTITIGTQIWMIENLKTTKYNDGSNIANITSDAAWSELNTGAYCWYNNVESNKNKYGALYNWHAVETNKLAPTGWHVPSDEEWAKLENYLVVNGANFNGSVNEQVNYLAMALSGNTHWTNESYVWEGCPSQNVSKNNQSGFTAIPAGSRYVDGPYWNAGNFGNWWSSTESFTNTAWFRFISNNRDNLNRSIDNKKMGYSVRCVSDKKALDIDILANDAINISDATATITGTLSIAGTNEIMQGIVYGTNPTPNIKENQHISNSGKNFNTTLTNLAASTKYYVRAFTSTENGIFYGNEINFTTLAPIKDYTVSFVAIGASTTIDSVIVENRTKNSKVKVLANSTLHLVSRMPATQPAHTNLLYADDDQLQFKAYSKSAGNYVIEFDKPKESKTIYFLFTSCVDSDNNTYGTITIGNQTWMIENLKTTKYNDGTNIPNITGELEWKDLTTSAYCLYENNAQNKNKYGALYNFHAVKSGKLAPTGWHIPTEAEWKKLEDYLTANGYNYDGTNSENKVAKALADTSTWGQSNEIGNIGYNILENNKSGFSARAAGVRSDEGIFKLQTEVSYFWTTTELFEYPMTICLGKYYNAPLHVIEFPKAGLSVRCVNNNPPIGINTKSADNINTSTATISGLIVANGSLISEQGIVYAKNSSPTIANNKMVTDSIINANLTGLQENTTYYVRAFATTTEGTYYGNEISFTTLKVKVDINTLAATNIDRNTASVGGTISNVGLTLSEQGIVYAKKSMPTTADIKIKTTGSSFTANITDLTASTQYFARAYAITSTGTVNYANEISFTTLAPIVDINTSPASNITIIGATISGTVSITGATITEQGVVYGTNPKPTTSDTKKTTTGASFKTELSSLSASTTYYVRSYVINSTGSTSYSNEISFKTFDASVLANTINVLFFNSSLALIGGNVWAVGTEVTEMGIVFGKNPVPTTTDTKVPATTKSFFVYLSGLTSNTSYFARSYAIASNGTTTYGNVVAFAYLEVAMNNISGGSIKLGSPTSEVSRNTDELQHQVTLSAFKMSKYEITNAQFACFLNTKKIGWNGINLAGKYPTQPLVYNSARHGGVWNWGVNYIDGKWVPAVGCENKPVTDVTWYGADEFATYAGGRLPTEAEWEYACRAGTNTPFNTGNFLTDLQANYRWGSPYNGGVNSGAPTPNQTLNVGSYNANAWGLYDMHGNVWEWVSDWMGDYPSTNQTDPQGAETGTKKVFRGGDWNAEAKVCRSAYRFSDKPDYASPNHGFRIVLK